MLDQQTRKMRGYYHYCPAVAMIVTARRGEEKDAMAAAWHSPISFDPPLYGVAVSPKRYTYEMISEAREFGVNFVPYSMANLVAKVGGCSGRDTDKFRRFGIKEVDPIETAAPIIEDSYAAYECRLFASNTHGDHEWFVGEVVAIHIDSTAFDQKGVLNLETAAPTLYMGMDFYLKVLQSERARLDRKKLADSDE
ncbi:MAG: flavin reductase family protein [Thermoplasmata archaeon]